MLEHPPRAAPEQDNLLPIEELWSQDLLLGPLLKAYQTGYLPNGLKLSALEHEHVKTALFMDLVVKYSGTRYPRPSTT